MFDSIEFLCMTSALPEICLTVPGTCAQKIKKQNLKKQKFCAGYSKHRLINLSNATFGLISMSVQTVTLPPQLALGSL